MVPYHIKRRIYGMLILVSAINKTDIVINLLTCNNDINSFVN